MQEILITLLQIVILGSAGYFVWCTFLMADAERLRRRKGMEDGTHDYYGNKIVDPKNKKI